MGRVDVEEMRRRNAPETASTNYDEIERSGIGMDGRILASPRLIQRVADVAADIIERKGCRENECSHDGVSHFWRRFRGSGHRCSVVEPESNVRFVTTGAGFDDVSWFTSTRVFFC